MHNRERFSLNVNAHHLSEVREVLGDEQGEKSKGASCVEEALSDTKLKHPSIHCRKCMDGRVSPIPFTVCLCQQAAIALQCIGSIEMKCLLRIMGEERADDHAKDLPKV